MSTKPTCFFEVVPDTYSKGASDDTPSEVLAEFEENARQDGFGDTVIERATLLCEGKCKSYDEYLTFLDKAIDSVQNDKEKEIARRKNVQRSIQIEIERLAEADIYALIDKKIYDLYNTRAVPALELIDECSKTFDTPKKEMYKECRYAVYLCTKSDWVKAALTVCLDRWESSMDAKKFVTNYLKRIKVDPANYNAGMRSLVSYLPENIKSENSPMLYKAFVSVQLAIAREFKGSSDFDSRVYKTQSYYSAIMDCTERNMPLLAVEQIATSMAAKKDNLVPNPQILLGHSTKLMCKSANSIQEAIAENMGSLYNDLLSARKAEKENHDQIRREKEVQKASARSAAIDKQVRVNQPPRRPQQAQPRKKEVVHKDFNPYMPNWLMFTIGGLVVSLVTLLFGKSMFVLSMVFTSVASYGWFAKSKGMRVNGKSPLLLIVGGYGCFMLLLLFRIM